MIKRMLNLFSSIRRIIGNIENWTTQTHLAAYQLILTQRKMKTSELELHQYGFKVYSQWEEDGILSFILDTMKLHKPRILELGAGNFLESNSRFLCEYFSAAAYLVDARNDLQDGIIESGLMWKTHIKFENTWVDTLSIKNIWSNALGYLKYIDILSIDVDGQDYWILKTIDLSEIKVIVCEFNPIFGGQIAVSVPEDSNFRRNAKTKNLFWGASLQAFNHLLKSQGFCLIGTNLVGNNAFFVQQKYLDKFNIILPIEEKNSFKIDYLIRESVDANGGLDFIDFSESQSFIENQYVFDLETESLCKLKDLLA